MKSKTIYVSLIIAILAVALICAVVYIKMFMGAPAVQAGSVNSMTLTSITYDNFASELSPSQIVQAIPKDSAIVLKFYNFNTGERQWEKAFLLKQEGIVQTGTDTTAEIVLSLDSKYLNGLTNQNFCTVIQTANAKGDLGFETELSQAALLWKFKSMLEYKECFGL